MTTLSILSVLLLWGTLLVEASIVRYAWLRRTASGAVPLILLIGIEVILILISWGEAFVYATAERTYITMVALFLLSLYGPIAFVLLLQLSGRTHWMTARTWGILSIEPLISILIGVAGDSQGLILERSWYTNGQPLDGSILSYVGPWLVFDTLYGYGLTFFAMGLLAVDYHDASPLFRRQIQFVLLSGLIAVLFDQNYVTYDFIVPPYVIDAVGMMSSSVILCIGLFYYQTLDLLPIANNRVIETLADGVIVLDAQLRIINGNPAAEQFIGHPLTSLIGLSARDAIFPTDQIAPLFHTQDASLGEMMITTTGGPICLHVQKTPIDYPRTGIVGYTLLIRDITSQKRLEILLTEAKEEAEADSQAKSDFLSLIGHELRTPLSVILLRSRILQKQIGKYPNDKQIASAQSIEENSRKLAALIDDMLEQARLQREERSVLTMADVFTDSLVRYAIMCVSADAEIKGVNVTFNTLFAPKYIYGDRQKLCQLMKILLEKALWLSAKGERIAIDIITNQITHNQTTYNQVEKSQRKQNQEMSIIQITISAAHTALDWGELDQIRKFFIPSEPDSLRADASNPIRVIPDAFYQGNPEWVRVKHLLELHYGQMDITITEEEEITFNVLLPSEHPLDAATPLEKVLGVAHGSRSTAKDEKEPANPSEFVSYFQSR
ncbi:MAG: histidine kinase N-terminal 7TM domain-containing protein [Chloroflexota bacterium]